MSGYLSGVLMSPAPAAGATQARVTAPAEGGLVTGTRARLAVRTGARVTRFRARLNGVDVTRAFRATGAGLRVAVISRGRALTLGANNLAVEMTSGGRRVSDFQSFVLARRSGTALGVRRLLGAASSSPIQVTALTREATHPTFRATLNGRRIDGAFGSPSPQRTAWLGAGDGLRFGRNVLRMLAYDSRGRYDNESRTITVPRTAPLAGTGPDRLVALGSAVRLDGRSSRAALGGVLSFRWRIVGKPRGARATLGNATTARPTLRTNRIGIHLVRLTVVERSGRGSASLVRQKQDLVTVDVVDPFPTVGVPFTTLDGSGRMVIDGQPVANTGGSNQISLVVLRRSDRSVVSSSNSFGPSQGLDRLRDAVGKVVDGDGEKDLVAITGTAGVSAGSLAAFEAILKRIGVGLTPDDRESLRAGKRFSIVGVPFAPANSGFVSVDRIQDVCPQSTPEGDLTGHLQRQFTTTPPTFGLVFGQYPRFDTSLPNPPANGNAMRVGDATYGATLPPGEGSAGFHIVALDRRTLEPIQFETSPSPLQSCDDLNFAIPMNTGDLVKDRNWQHNLAEFLREATEADALVLFQSIGTPRPTTPAWTEISDRLEKLGANRAVFNGIGTGSPDPGKGVYAFVGAVGMDAPAAESSQPLTGRPGHSLGVLERSRRAIFQPLLADSVAGTFNQKLMDIAYQPPRPFSPSFDTDGEKNANLWLSQQMHLTPGDVRRDFVIDYTSDWAQAALELNDAKYPGKLPDKSFTEDEFNKVKAALKNDVSAYNRVRHYLDQVRAPVENSGLAIYVNLNQIGSDIQTAINPPPAGGAQTSKALKVISGIIGVGSALPPPAGNVATAFSGVFSVASALALPDGSQVGGDISGKVSDLASQLVQRFDAARKGLQGLTLVIVGDGGKLTDMAARLNDADWKLPPEADSVASDAIRKSTARWFYSSLMPAAYSMYQLRGITSANDYECRVNGYQKVFVNEPGNGQDLQTTGFAGSPLAPTKVVYALGVDVNFSQAQPQARVPPTSLVDPLFQPADQPVRYPKGLGMFKPYFYSSTNFPINSAPDHRADCS